MDVLTIKAEAIGRVVARRQPPKMRAYLDPETGEMARKPDPVAGGPDDLAPASNLSDWCDDRIARLPADPPFGTFIEILEAARAGGVQGAVLATCKAQALDGWAQFSLYSTLERLPVNAAGAAECVTAIRAEWRRLRLAMVPPRSPMPPGGQVGPNVSAPPGTAMAPAAASLLERSEWQQRQLDHEQRITARRG